MSDFPIPGFPFTNTRRLERIDRSKNSPNFCARIVLPFYVWLHCQRAINLHKAASSVKP
jgi:hypothetical protein